jgi:prepilin signal peptidase PulO-like enzyme (type II secretory pathway)
MNRRSSSSSSGKPTVVALLVTAAGIVIQIFSGIDFPTVPPGLVIVLVAAGLIAFGPWWWTPVVGAILGVWLLVGFSLSGEAGRLVDPSGLGGFVGLWIQLVAVIVAIATGIVATARNLRAGARPARRTP